MHPCFVADTMLGRLAKWLRALGCDCLYHPAADHHSLIALARERSAIALTRNTRFPKPPDVRIILISHDHVKHQLSQLLREVPLDLAQAQPLTRCTVCNHPLHPAARDEVWNRIPPFVYLTTETYARCSNCGRVYWEGTHAPRLRRQLALISQPATGGRPE